MTHALTATIVAAKESHTVEIHFLQALEESTADRIVHALTAMGVNDIKKDKQPNGSVFWSCGTAMETFADTIPIAHILHKHEIQAVQ